MKKRLTMFRLSDNAFRKLCLHWHGLVISSPMYNNPSTKIPPMKSSIWEKNAYIYIIYFYISNIYKRDREIERDRERQRETKRDRER